RRQWPGQPVADTARRGRSHASAPARNRRQRAALRRTAAPEPRPVKPLHWLIASGAVLLPVAAQAAAPGIPAVVIEGEPGAQSYSLTLQLLILMTAVTLLPSIVLMMTSFTRIVIVLAILRQAIGAGQAPPNQVLIGLALFLSLFVMAPVIGTINTEAVQPYMAGTIETTEALQRAAVPLKQFMLAQTRESDIATFVSISGGQGFD